MGRWLQPAQCINSSLVGKVVLDSGVEAVHQCSPMGRLLGDKPDKSVISLRLPERLNNLESLVGFLNPVVPVTVHIREKLHRQLLVTPGRLDISLDLLKEPKVFERALMFAEFPNDTDFSAAVKSEFLLEENLWGTHQGAGRARVPWIAHLKGLGNYCRSSYVIAAHLTYCDVHNEYGDSFITDSKLGPTPWSLVPVFVRGLESAYATLGIAAKERMMRNLMFLNEPDSGSIASLAQAKSLDQANNYFADLMRNWLMPLILNSRARRAAVQSASLPAGAPIRYVVIDRSARDSFPIDDIEMGKMATPRKLTVVGYGLKKYVVPNDVPYSFTQDDLLKNHAIKRLIYVSCEIPEVDNLLQFGDGVKRVLYVRQCVPQDMNWSKAFAMGVEQYLGAHPETEFMEFNLSALRLAQQQEGPLRNSSSLINWEHWLKWQNVVVDDEEPTALRPLAVIEGVRRFRMIH